MKFYPYLLERKRKVHQRLRSEHLPCVHVGLKDHRETALFVSQNQPMLEPQSLMGKVLVEVPVEDRAQAEDQEPNPEPDPDPVQVL